MRERLPQTIIPLPPFIAAQQAKSPLGTGWKAYVPITKSGHVAEHRHSCLCAKWAFLSVFGRGWVQHGHDKEAAMRPAALVQGGLGIMRQVEIYQFRITKRLTQKINIITTRSIHV